MCKGENSGGRNFHYFQTYDKLCDDELCDEKIRNDKLCDDKFFK